MVDINIHVSLGEARLPYYRGCSHSSSECVYLLATELKGQTINHRVTSSWTLNGARISLQNLVVGFSSLVTGTYATHLLHLL